MAWLALFLAGAFEIGWPLGLKNGWTPEGARPAWIAFAVACICLSGALLLYAQRTIPIGTAYAVWTGIGAAGTFVLGVVLFGEAASLVRVLSVGLIVAGVVGLRMG